jgi:transposase
MITPENVRCLEKRWAVMAGELDERARRLWAASEAKSLGYGGVSAVARATGLAIETIRTGIRELDKPTEQAERGLRGQRRIRSQGAGRKPLIQKDPALLGALGSLVESTTRGDPMSPLRWTCKSTRNLAAELERQGHTVGERTVASLLQDFGYSLQGNRKTKEGRSHPDRNAQFEHINAQVKAFHARGQPVVSVDAKKKELVGNFRNAGREWRKKGQPEEVKTHDFEDKDLGKGIPYGVYDEGRNEGWVSVGVDHDTAEFAVHTIRWWWERMGRETYTDAREVLITADGGGSNGSRIRLWKLALQQLADETGLRISVCHFPPGTSKWNRIEHRMFCHITKNWRARPLESLEVIVNLIGSTTTRKGLRIQAALDTGSYPKGIKVSDDELAQVRIERDGFHGEWNYAILPRVKPIEL